MGEPVGLPSMGSHRIGHDWSDLAAAAAAALWGTAIKEQHDGHLVFVIKSWTIRRLSTEELMPLTVVLEKILDSPWTLRRSNQSILKEIHEYLSPSVNGCGCFVFNLDLVALEKECPMNRFSLYWIHVNIPSPKPCCSWRSWLDLHRTPQQNFLW